MSPNSKVTAAELAEAEALLRGVDVASLDRAGAEALVAKLGGPQKALELWNEAAAPLLVRERHPDLPDVNGAKDIQAWLFEQAAPAPPEPDVPVDHPEHITVEEALAAIEQIQREESDVLLDSSAKGHSHLKWRWAELHKIAYPEPAAEAEADALAPSPSELDPDSVSTAVPGQVHARLEADRDARAQDAEAAPARALGRGL